MVPFHYIHTVRELLFGSMKYQQWFSDVQQSNARLFSGAVLQNFVSLCKHHGLPCDFENDLYLNT